MAKRKIVFDVVGALIKEKGRILVCQRLDDDLFGSLWEFPGGKVEKGENKIAALKREIKEELDIEVKVGKLIHIFEDELPAMKPCLYGYRERQIIKQGGMNPALAKTHRHYIYLLNNKVKTRKQFSQAKVETGPCQESKGGMKIIVYLYRCNIIRDRPHCIECQNLKWVTLEQIGKLSLAPCDRKIHHYLAKNLPC